MTFLSALVLVGAIVGWILVWVSLLTYATAHEWVGGYLLVIALIVVPMAGVISWADQYDQGDHPTTLCLSGHQVWVSTGKTRDKHWICDQWEVR